MTDFLPENAERLETYANQYGEVTDIYKTPDGLYIVTIEDAPYTSGKDYKTIINNLKRRGYIEE